jgi:integrase
MTWSRATTHLTPAFGQSRLDQIRYAEIQDYAARKTETLSAKTVNNHLTVLRRLLIVAKKRELIEAVPEIEWLKVPRPDFDFLSFEEGARLTAATDPQWKCMIMTAMKTGLRQRRAPGAALGGHRPRLGAAAGQTLRHAWRGDGAEEWEAEGSAVRR